MYEQIKVQHLRHWWGTLTFNSQDLISDSPYWLPYSSCGVSLENLVLNQLIIPQLIFFFILITCLLNILYWYCKGKFCFDHSWELKGEDCYCLVGCLLFQIWCIQHAMYFWIWVATLHNNYHFSSWMHILLNKLSINMLLFYSVGLFFLLL